MYRYMILLSFISGLSVAGLILRSKKVPKGVMLLSLTLELGLTIYISVLVAYFLAGAKRSGLNGTGGALGILIGAFTFSKIFLAYKEAFYSAYVMVLPLMYGIGKIGCAFAGCCAGIPYDGFLHVHTDAGNLFPIQALEAVVFLLLFAASLYFFMKNSYNPLIAAIIYCIAKILLDFPRDTHIDKPVTTNQIMCSILVIVLGVFYVRTLSHRSRAGS